MSRRSDSKIDLDKYQPSLEDALRAADEAAAQARLQKALDNPALDAALADLRGEPGAPPAQSSTAPEAAPGPGTKGAPEAPPVTSRIRARGRDVQPRRWSATSKGLAAIALAFVPATMVYVLFVRPQPRDLGQPASSTSVTAASAASTPTSSSASVAPAPASAAVTTPSAEPTAPPSVTATPSAVPSVAPSSPSARSPSKSLPPTKRRSPGDDPYDDPSNPPAPKTAEPAPPPPPASAPQPPTKPKIIN